MPHWPTSDISAGERVRAQFALDFNTAPEYVAEAPSTYPVIGEYVDHYGGTVVLGVGSARVAVAVGRAESDDVTLTIHRIDGTTEHDRVSARDVAHLAAAQLPGVDDAGRPTVPPAPRGGPATRLGGIVHTMISRQLVPRDTTGLNISVVSDVPAGPALGEAEAVDAAFALTLQADAEDISEAPLRARLAELCAHSADSFSSRPLSRSRYTAALRALPDSLAVIDYADGSLTQAPHPISATTRAFALLVPGAEGDDGEKIRRKFLDDARQAFGADSLRLLPDARDRVLDWLRAVHKVHPDAGAPPVAEADTWLAYFEEETARAQQVAVALRSRRIADVWAFLADSHRETTQIAGSETALAELALSRGAMAARVAGAGAVVCFVPAGAADNFSADLAADGLMVVELGVGDAADLV